MDQKLLGIRISEDVIKAFKKYVKSKWGRTHGFYGKEVENALKFYMTWDGRAPQKPPGRPSLAGPSYEPRENILDNSDIENLLTLNVGGVVLEAKKNVEHVDGIQHTILSWNHLTKKKNAFLRNFQIATQMTVKLNHDELDGLIINITGVKDPKSIETWKKLLLKMQYVRLWPKQDYRGYEIIWDHIIHPEGENNGE